MKVGTSDLHQVKVNSEACCERNFSFGVRPSVRLLEDKRFAEEAQTLLSSGGSRVWPGASDQVPEPSQLAPFKYLSSSHSLWTSLPVTKMVLTMIVKLFKYYFIDVETRVEHR